jgi:hypothetical protein
MNSKLSLLVDRRYYRGDRINAVFECLVVGSYLTEVIFYRRLHREEKDAGVG